MFSLTIGCAALAVVLASAELCEAAGLPPNEIDQVLSQENEQGGVSLEPAPLVDDLAYLRRITVDLIGRIPTEEEIQQYMSWPADRRRARMVEELLGRQRFADRWTVFFADMLRIRSGAEGGGALMAYVHQAVEQGMPYDKLVRQLISASGKAGAVPQVGFVLGDQADPLALASATAQTFMGVRMGCAQCHDHPFDVWTREDFYGLAAYFGKTRRVERNFNDKTLAVYTTDAKQSNVLWPPEGVGEASQREPMQATFPVELAGKKETADYRQRLAALRAEQKGQQQSGESSSGPSVDDLLASAAEVAAEETNGGTQDPLGVVEEAKRDVQQVDLSVERTSELRQELARLVTHPRNRYFSRAFVNRVWAQLIGRGFVEPVDDFSFTNQPTRPQALNYLADEFVARGYKLRELIRMIVTSRVYQRGHAADRDEATRKDLQAAFLATPMRRMIAEVLYDSIVTAGHLFKKKHKKGANLNVVWQRQRVPKKRSPEASSSGQKVRPQSLAEADDSAEMKAKQRQMAAVSSPYNVEKAIEVDFDSVLKKSQNQDGAMVDSMQFKSAEEIEAERMAREAQQENQNVEYVDRFVKTVYDDNPTFGSALRMASPAPAGHFLRVFGQPSRQDLGDLREHKATMRQALLMLNGQLAHEASRVGALEPIYPLLKGESADLEEAIRLAYREILTRRPTPQEMQDAKGIVGSADTRLKGMADLRWVLLNSNEFRFLP